MGDLSEISYTCPYCGEAIETLVAPSELPAELIEDCRVCCHPILLRLSLSPAGEPQLIAEIAQ